MRSMTYRWTILVLTFTTSLSVLGQVPGGDGPYYLSLRRELGVGTVAAGSALTGYLINQNIDEVALRELSLPKVPGFDESALGNVSSAALSGSDIVAYGTVALPVTLLLDRRIRADAVKVGLLFVETMLLNQGLTDIVKGTVQRPRPYLYDPQLPADSQVDAYDRTSYFSAHTSNTAAASFFIGRVFADYHPDSPLKPVVWTVSATLPAVAGYLRVRAGQHFPSDVVTGYLVGAAIGYGIPALHRRPVRVRGVSLRPTGTGLYLCYTFGGA
ncbi:phosphatase PAP2 family protein [Lewinella sp. IMCC34183]|uniref:phosphatase PAP2 family protein n=1 Tax=Lewinella sp. IMCC34183 TaxID=2248762 RepID=UPI0013005992|nr:phosphatase PAP2 family protein [Lewinella sp. IMCC34183]